MKKIVIAISGTPGAGSSSVAKLLAEKIGLEHFSPGRLYKDLAKGYFKKTYYYQDFKKILEEKDLQLPNLKNQADSKATIDLWKINKDRLKVLHESIDELQEKLSKKGNIVIDGKLSIRMIKNATFKIWFKADLEVRVQRIKGRENLTSDETRTIILEREKLERSEWKRIYGFDYFDQEKEANLVLDTSKMNQQEIVNLIIEKLKSKTF